MKHLAAVAHWLPHARDLGGYFVFLTWFEYAPSYAQEFDGILAEFRGSAEWRHVEREVSMRVTRT